MPTKPSTPHSEPNLPSEMLVDAFRRLYKPSSFRDDKDDAIKVCLALEEAINALAARCAEVGYKVGRLTRM